MIVPTTRNFVLKTPTSHCGIIRLFYCALSYVKKNDQQPQQLSSVANGSKILKPFLSGSDSLIHHVFDKLGKFIPYFIISPYFAIQNYNTNSKIWSQTT